MNYQMETCAEKTIWSLAEAIPGAEIANAPAVIGGLWQRFHQMLSQTPAPVYGLYSGYRPDGGYTAAVGCTSPEDGLTKQVIPAGTYAVFTIHGDVQKDVGRAWQEIGQMDLPRTFLCDYEEYLGGTDLKQMEIKIYVGIR